MRMRKQIVRAILPILACTALLYGCAMLTSTEAVIDVSATSGVVPLTIAFDGSGSSGPDGITTFRWSFGTGDERYGESGTYTYQRAGRFELSLTVRGADGNTATESVWVDVDPAIWVADENLNVVYRLDMQGAVLDAFAVPRPQPKGITIADVGGETRLLVACYGGGNQRILQMDPATGAVLEERVAPAQSPLYLTYGASAPERVWHLDGLSRKIYELDRGSGQVLGSFGINYFRASLQIGNIAFLYAPQGIAWTPATGKAGILWYMEGETELLYQIEIVPATDFMSGTQLEIHEDAVAVDSTLFPVGGMDWYDGYLWVVDVNHHQIVQIDPETGQRTGQVIGGFPGATASGLEIQQ